MHIFPPIDIHTSFIKIYRLEDLPKDTFTNYSRLDLHQLIWFTDIGDDAFFSVDFIDFKAANQEATVIYPDQIVTTDLTNKKGYLLVIHNDVFFQINQKIGSDYLNGYFMNQFVSIDSKSAKAMKKIIDLMFEESSDENRILLLESYLSSFLFFVSSVFDKHSSHTQYIDYPVFGKLMRLIDLHFTEEKETAFYTQHFIISAKKLNQICKSITNRNIKQLIQERIVLEIRKELQLGKKNIKEIAYDLGFTEPAYLTRFFKKQTGVTPKEFSKP